MGNRTYCSERWRTFHDFLRDYLFDLFGKDWFDAERAKPGESRHRIMHWFDHWIALSNSFTVRNKQILSEPMTGAIRAFLNLAYNLYLISHHTATLGDSIVKGYVKRLKSHRADDFSGVLFETYAAAAFLKAGFTVNFEDERDGSTSHVEFVATYPETQKSYSVEVKAREKSMASHTAQGTDTDDFKRLRVANKLNKALGNKKAEHTRVVLIEINVPEVVTSDAGWPTAALKQIRENEKVDFPGGDKKPSAYVFVTNHSFHNNLEVPDRGLQVLATGFHIPDFGPDAPNKSYKNVLEARERHREMFALMKSMQTHYEIPATFDGDMPQLAFQSQTHRRVFNLGGGILFQLKMGLRFPDGSMKQP